MPLDPNDITKLFDALATRKAEFQAERDAAQDAEWAADCGNDPIIMMARRLARAWDRRPTGPVQVPETAEDVEVLQEQKLDYAKTLFSLAEAVGREERRKEMEEAGTLQRQRPVVTGPRICRSYGGNQADVMAKTGGDGKPTRKLTRTEVFQQQEQAGAASQLAHLLPPTAGRDSGGAWRNGDVVRFDSRTRDGVVAVGGLQLTFVAAETVRSGVTTLSPRQEIEALIKKRPDDTYMVAEIRLSAGARAAAINELEKQSQAAEERYQLFARPKLH